MFGRQMGEAKKVHGKGQVDESSRKRVTSSVSVLPVEESRKRCICVPRAVAIAD